MACVNGVYRFGFPCNMTLNNFSINDKFCDDNVSVETDNYIMVLEGCVLNKNLLKNKYKEKNLFSLISLLWDKYEEEITKQLRGAFVLIIYDKKNNKLFISNDLLSKKPIYYYSTSEVFIFSSSYFDLIQLLKENNEKVSLNKLSIAMMLTKGYLGDNVTYANEIHYLSGYKYLVIQSETLHERKYYINNNILKIEEEEIIFELDKRFSSAIEEQFNKNFEYGYDDILTLSAGMDSRTCLLYADNLGYKDILCVSYSQSNSVDYLISKQIATDYGFEYIFYPLDSATFILNVDDLCIQNECQQIYAGATGAYQTFEIVNTNNCGIIHTGSFGGELLSDIFNKPRFTEINLDNATMEILPLWCDELTDSYITMKRKYKSEEEYLLYEHMRTCQNFMRMVEDKCEALSPFMHEDFFCFANRITPEFRYRRNIYRKWMNEYIPNNYVTTYYKSEINSNYYKEITIKIYNRFKKMIMGKNKFDMNPMEYWGKTVPNLSKEVNLLFETELKNINNISNDIEDSIKLVKNQGINGSVRAITVIKALINAGF